MEFIIVLPIYFVFIGMVFVFGEMSLHGVNMAASGDRTLAAAAGLAGDDGNLSAQMSKFAGWIAGVISPDKSYETDPDLTYADGTEAKVSQFNLAKRAVKVADPEFKGSWWCLAASTLVDDYALTPWTRSMALNWQAVTSAKQMTEMPEDATAGGDDGNDLLNKDRLGRFHEMVSKAGVRTLTRPGKREYAYYTLMRNHKGRTSYRSWDAGALVDGVADKATWYCCVFLEGFPEADDDFYENLNDDAKYGAAPASAAERAAYERYPSFKTWSE